MPSFLKALLLYLSTISVASALQIGVPSTVAAGTNFTIEIDTDLSKGAASVDKNFSSYSVLLYMEVPNIPPPKNTFLACYLLESATITQTSLNLQIPPNVGPDYWLYRLATREYPKGTSLNDPCQNETLIGSSISTPFNFTSGTSNWTDFELNVKNGPRNNADEDIWFVPCTAYACARQCNQEFYPDNMKNFPAQFKSTYACEASCPGVNYPSFESYLNPSCGANSTTSPGSKPTANSSSTETTKSGKSAGLSKYAELDFMGRLPFAWALAIIFGYMGY